LPKPPASGKTEPPGRGPSPPFLYEGFCPPLIRRPLKGGVITRPGPPPPARRPRNSFFHAPVFWHSPYALLGSCAHCFFCFGFFLPTPPPGFPPRRLWPPNGFVSPPPLFFLHCELSPCSIWRYRPAPPPPPPPSQGPGFFFFLGPFGFFFGPFVIVSRF